MNQSHAATESAAGNPAKWLVLISVGIGTFMSAIDGSVVNATLPVIRNAFHATVAGIEWTVTVYLLVVSGLLLTFGRLGDLRGHRPVYITGYFIFIAGSAVCGLATSALWLVVARAFQAVGAAMLLANSPAILTGNFPPNQRGQALGIQATLTYLGLSTGPSLGGWLTQQFSWRAIFYINIPIGLTALFLSMRFIPQDKPREHQEPFDLAGAVTFLAGLVALLFGLNQGHAWGWTSPLLLGTLALAVVLLGVFVRLELRSPSPMLDLSLFRRREFSSATGAALMNYIAMYSIVFLMPFYLLQGRGLNTAQAGLLLTAQPLVMAVFAPISGTLSDRIGSRWLSTIGMLVMAVGMWLLARLGPDSSNLQIILALATAGLGIGVFISPNTNSLLSSAPRNRQGIASGVLATARNVGMVLGVGLAGAIFTTILTGAAENDLPQLYLAVRTAFYVSVGVALLGALFVQLRGGKPADLTNSR